MPNVITAIENVEKDYVQRTLVDPAIERIEVDIVRINLLPNNNVYTTAEACYGSGCVNGNALYDMVGGKCNGKRVVMDVASQKNKLQKLLQDKSEVNLLNPPQILKYNEGEFNRSFYDYNLAWKSVSGNLNSDLKAYTKFPIEILTHFNENNLLKMYHTADHLEIGRLLYFEINKQEVTEYERIKQHFFCKFKSTPYIYSC